MEEGESSDTVGWRKDWVLTQWDGGGYDTVGRRKGLGSEAMGGGREEVLTQWGGGGRSF